MSQSRLIFCRGGIRPGEILIAMKKFVFNEHGVCTEPERIVVFEKDGLNKIVIGVAFSEGGWSVGYEVWARHSGTVSPCSLRENYPTREQAVNVALNCIEKLNVVEENPRYLKMIRTFKASRMQLTLF